jgi:DnaJ family protein A protein 2
LHHPDKVAEADREAADQKFKDIGQAYEILNDDQKRHRYDAEGMAAFDPARNSSDMGGMPPDIDLADILSQMMFNSGPPLEEPLTLAVSLEDLYNGKLKKVRLEKNVICDRCNGHGGKEGTVPKECRTCDGRGQVPRRAGSPYTPHMIVVDCPTCSGNKKIFTEKEKCKKCKGKGVNKVQKYVEIYVAPGSEYIHFPGQSWLRADSKQVG